MNILRLSTLSLTLAVAVFALSLAIPAFAAPKKCADAPPGTPGCGGGDDTTGTVYTVELMGRVFHFDDPTMDFTETEKGGMLLPDPAMPLTFSRPGAAGADCIVGSFDDTVQAICAWDAVFAACENFFGPTPIIGPTPIVVSQFTVPPGDWRVNKPGGVRLQMLIPFDSMGNSPPIVGPQYLQVSLQLIGNTLFDSPKAPWLPVPGSSPIEYNIVDFWITGKTVKGVSPKIGCVSGGSAEQTDFDPGQVRTLVITAPSTE